MDFEAVVKKSGLRERKEKRKIRRRKMGSTNAVPPWGNEQSNGDFGETSGYGGRFIRVKGEYR